MNFHIIIDHPWKDSFNYAVLDSFISGIENNHHSFDLLDLNRTDFNPIMSELELANYSKGISIDPKIKDHQARLLKTDHLVLIFPIWWNVMPARLKGWMDKVLLPGFAFSTDQVPVPMLSHIQGATIFTTTGTPDEYHRKEFNNALEWVLCKGTLEFCGIRPTKWFNFGDTGFVDRSVHSAWLENIKNLAMKF
jgi:putative NADPH-quinone reductase